MYAYATPPSDAEKGVLTPRRAHASRAGTPVAEAGDLPLRARSLAVSFPMPVLAPVIITTFPSSLAVDLHWPPATYLLRERPAALRDEVRGHRPSSGASGQGSAPGDPGFAPKVGPTAAPRAPGSHGRRYPQRPIAIVS